MLSPIILAVVCGLALLVAASIRRVPEGHVYTFRRMGGHVRIVGSGTHLVVPLVERVANKISLAGAALAVEGLQRDGGAVHRAVVYFQVLDPQRADVVIEDIENLLRTLTRRVFGDAAMPDDNEARRRWLKQVLNAELHERGLLIARVDLAAAG